MAIGDNAASKGYDLVNPITDVVSEGATEINYTRDLVADEVDARTAAVALKLDASRITYGTAAPSGGSNGDIYLKYVP